LNPLEIIIPRLFPPCSFLGKKMSFSILWPNLDENSYGFRVSFLIKNVPSLCVGSSLASLRGRGEVGVRVQI